MSRLNNETDPNSANLPAQAATVALRCAVSQFDIAGPAHAAKESLSITTDLHTPIVKTTNK